MGIFDWSRRKQKEPASPTERKKATLVDSAIARLSNTSTEERAGAAMELLKSPDYGIRVAVASEVARLEIKAIGVWYELANALADDYESVRLASAKAFWQLDGVAYAIRSLRDEHESPAKMSRESALRGICTLMEVASEKSNFDNLLKESWQDCPLLAEREQTRKSQSPIHVKHEERENKREEWITKANELKEQGQYDKAFEYLDLIIRANLDTNGWALYLKGSALMELDRHEEAAECFKQSLKIDPVSDTCEFDLGRALYEIGNCEEARSHFEKLARGTFVYGVDKKAKEWLNKMEPRP